MLWKSVIITTVILFWNIGFCVEIPLLARRKNSILLLLVDTERRNTTTLRWPIVTGIDEELPISMTSDVKSKSVIYNEGWSKKRHNRIRVASFNRNRQSEVGREIRRHGGVAEEVVTSLAYDWVTEKIFVAVEQTSSLQNLGRIEACPMSAMTTFSISGNSATKALDNGKECATLLHRNLDSLHYLVVDPIDGYMYWLNRMRKRVERAWMNGQHLDKRPFYDINAEDDTKADGLTFGLTLDVKRRALFFIRTSSTLLESNAEIVMCKLYDRMSCRVIIGSIKALELAIFENFLLWIRPLEAGLRKPYSSVSDSQLANGMQACELERCSSHVFNISSTGSIGSIAVFDIAVQPAKSNPCEINNGGCSHICLLIPGAPWRSCACPLGVRLTSNNLDCAANGLEKVLLVGSLNGLFYISLDTKDYIAQRILVDTSFQDSESRFDSNQQHQPSSVSGIGGAQQKFIDVDYDPIDQKIYWIDREAQSIKRCRLNGSNYEEVITENLSREVDSLAIDWIGRNLIWSNSASGRIELAKLLSPNIRKTLLSHNVYRPKGLSIDSVNHKIYFANFFGGETKIEKVWMDGSHREVLLVLPKVSSWLSDIVLEPAEDRLYWSDRERSQIFKARLSDASEIGVIARDLKNPNSISKLDSTIFYNSLGGRFLTAVTLNSVNDPQNVYFGKNASMKHDFSESEIYGQTSLKAVYLKPMFTNQWACSYSNGGCQHICVQLINMSKCLCTSGFELQTDGLSCHQPSQFLAFSQKLINGGGLFRSSSTLHFSINLERINLFENLFAHTFSVVPTALAVDPIDQYIYWSVNSITGNSGAIVRSSFDKENTEFLLESKTLINICGLAVDSLFTGNIFVCNDFLKRIEVISSDNKLRRSLLWNRDLRPKFLAISPRHWTIYFANFHRNSSFADICEFNYGPFSCTSYSIIVSKAGNLTSLSVDETFGRLFWSTVSINSNGEEIGSIFSILIEEKIKPVVNQKLWVKSNKIIPSAIVAHTDFLYLANTARNSVEYLNIRNESEKILLSMSTQILHSGIVNVTAIVVAHKQNRNNDPKVLESEYCVGTRKTSMFDLKRQHLQSQCLCLPYLSTPTMHCQKSSQNSCSCGDQLSFDTRWQACRPPTDFLLFAFDNQILRFSVRLLENNKTLSNSENFLGYIFDADPFVILPIENVGRPLVLEFDILSLRRFLYWIDAGAENENLELKRASDIFSSTAQSVVLAATVNCLKFFSFTIDFTGRQLFVSCARRQSNRVGSIHLWKIMDDEEESLFYIGTIVDGQTQKSTANNVPPLPKEVCVFGKLGALFYVDHSPLLDSPSLIRCGLDGRHCVHIISTGMNLFSPIILKSILASNRIVYSTSTGIWSQKVLEQKYFNKKYLNDSNRFKHIALNLPNFVNVDQNEAEVRRPLIMSDESHLVLDRSADINDIIPINESIMLVIATDLTSSKKNKPQNLFELYLPEESDSVSLGQLRKAEWLNVKPLFDKNIIAASIAFSSDYTQIKHNGRADLYSPCKNSECSHICQIKPTSKAAPKKHSLFFSKKNFFEKTKRLNFDENNREQANFKHADSKAAYTCLCPLNYGISTEDSTNCKANVVCANWEFACHNGRACIHIAQRCNRFANCEDGSDELPSVCSPLNLLTQVSEGSSFDHLQVTQNHTKVASISTLIHNYEWVCDDGTTMIKKYLFCDGKADCADESDEAHCRCSLPSDYFDCSAWEHTHSLTKTNTSSVPNCIIRGMLCDGRDHCSSGADERIQLCVLLPTIVHLPIITSVLDNGYNVAAIVFIIVLILVLPLYCLCFIYRDKQHKQNKFLKTINESATFLTNQSQPSESLKNEGRLNHLQEAHALLAVTPSNNENMLLGKRCKNYNANDMEEPAYYTSLPRSGVSVNYRTSVGLYHCIRHTIAAETSDCFPMHNLNLSSALHSQRHLQPSAENASCNNNADYHCVIPFVNNHHHHHHHSSTSVVRLPTHKVCCSAGRLHQRPSQTLQEHRVIQDYNLEMGTTVSQLAAETPFCRCLDCVRHEVSLITPHNLSNSPIPIHLHHYGVLAPPQQPTPSATSSVDQPLPPPPNSETQSLYNQEQAVFNAPPPSQASQFSMYGINSCYNKKNLNKMNDASNYTRSLLRPKKLAVNSGKISCNSTFSTTNVNTAAHFRPAFNSITSKKKRYCQADVSKYKKTNKTNNRHHCRQKRLYKNGREKNQESKKFGASYHPKKNTVNVENDDNFMKTSLQPPPSYAEVSQKGFPFCSTPIDGKSIVSSMGNCAESTIPWSILTPSKIAPPPPSSVVDR